MRTAEKSVDPSGTATPAAIASDPRIDLAGGIAVIGLGVAALVGAARIPRTGSATGLTLYLTYPGALPLLLGFGLIIGGVVIAVSAWRRGGRPDKSARAGLAGFLRLDSVRRGSIVLGLITAYALSLIAGALSFWAATYFFLSLTLVWLRAGPVWKVMVISLGTALLLQLLFGTLMRLPLP